MTVRHLTQHATTLGREAQIGYAILQDRALLKITINYQAYANIVLGFSYSRVLRGNRQVADNLDEIYWYCKARGEPQWVAQIRLKSTGKPGNGWFPSGMDWEKETQDCRDYMDRVTQGLPGLLPPPTPRPKRRRRAP